MKKKIKILFGNPWLIFFLALVFVVLHNLFYAVFNTEEAVFFLLGIPFILATPFSLIYKTYFSFKNKDYAKLFVILPIWLIIIFVVLALYGKMHLLINPKQEIIKVMQLLILPGYSIKNEEWAKQMQKELSDLGKVDIHYWSHWKTGHSEPDWIENEAKTIVGEAANNGINILAKSIGTAVAVEVIKSTPKKVEKVILCGIPVYDFVKEDGRRYEVLNSFPSEKVLVIQNISDNHGNLEDVNSLIKKINPKIQIISKPRSDHEYYYAEDFISFFADK